MNATKPILILVISCFGFCHSATQEKEGPLSSQKFANECAIFEAAILNSSAWKNGDCLAVEEVLLDNVTRTPNGEFKGIVITRKSRIRSIFDFEKKRYANFRLSSTEFTDFDTIINGEPLSVNETKWSSGCVDFVKGEIWLNDSTAGYRNILLLGDETLETVNGELGFRDYRACWDTNGFDKQAFEIAKTTLEFVRRGYGCKSAKSKDGVLELKSQGVCNLPDVDGPFMTHRFDLESSMPVYFSEKLVHRKTKEDINPEVRRLKWSSLNGIYVPSRIVIAEPLSFLVNQKRQTGHGSQELNFDWYSLNDDRLNEKFFDGSFVGDFENLMKMVNPPKSKKGRK